MLLMSVVVSGVSLLVGILLGRAAGWHEERSRWESRIAHSVLDGHVIGDLGNSRRSGLDARDDRLEQAIEAIAIEVERVSEGQRFVTRLLAERGQPLPSPLTQPKQSITPH